MSIKHEYVVQYDFACSNPEHKQPDEDSWEDEGGCSYTFDPNDLREKELALEAANAYALYVAHQDNKDLGDDDHKTVYRVVYRLTSDEVVSA